MKSIVRSQTTAIYILALSIIFATVVNSQSASGGTKEVNHIKNIEKYLLALDACLYSTYLGMESVYAKSPAEVKKCQAILGKFTYKFW